MRYIAVLLGWVREIAWPGTLMFPLTLFNSPSTTELTLQILTLITTAQAKEIPLIYALWALSTIEMFYFFFVTIGLTSAFSTNDDCNKSHYHLNVHSVPGTIEIPWRILIYFISTAIPGGKGGTEEKQLGCDSLARKRQCWNTIQGSWNCAGLSSVSVFTDYPLTVSPCPAQGLV